MSEAKFTPGPWELSTFTRADGQPIATVDDVADAVAASARWPGGVAELWGVTIPGTGDVIAYTGNGPTREANARLIAAAPIGYELSNEILRACDRGTGRQISDGTRQEIEPLRKLAEQFMAAARGEATT